jgi:hypothetical protein
METTFLPLITLAVGLVVGFVARKYFTKKDPAKVEIADALAKQFGKDVADYFNKL